MVHIKNYQILAFASVLVLCVNLCSGTTAADSWIKFTREARTVFKSCPKNDISPYSLWACIKQSSLELFDRITSADIIPLTEQIRLVRYQQDNAIKDPKRIQLQNSNLSGRSFEGVEIDKSFWLNHVGQRSMNVLSSHAIQVDLGNMVEGRARHRRGQMLPIMVFGMTAIGMIMVPIGFQLLAMLGGKALLLSKMALLLASINGLKRVASSGVHYGLYHADPHVHIPWDRNEAAFNRPRAFPSHRSERV